MGILDNFFSLLSVFLGGGRIIFASRPFALLFIWRGGAWSERTMIEMREIFLLGFGWRGEMSWD